MRALGFLFLFCVFTTSAIGAEKEAFVKIGKESIWLRHKTATRGAPTVVLLNGLTYATRDWAPFASALERLNPDLGIVRYDMRGMGKTLLEGRLPVNYAIPHTDQVNHLKAILDLLGLKRVHLVGLSYGGGIGIAFAEKHPRMVDKLVLMAPFTEALESQDASIKKQIAWTRITFPLNPASDDELYDYFLRQTIYTTYPAAEPMVLENPYKLEAIFRMVQGIRKFKATEFLSNLPAGSVHLMVANQDQYIPQPVMDRFWAALPKAARASRINISYTEHKIPEAIPAFAATWVNETFSNNTLSGGKIFSGDAQGFEARSGTLRINLPRP
jgi:pimeloyl-ACP methyl ester carboxylesterase